MAKHYAIEAPVVDLRSEPKVLSNQDFSHQDLRESQLLYNEKIELLDENGEWLKIAALEQLCFNDSKSWHPYQGWILKSEAKELSQAAKPRFVICKPNTHFSYGTYLHDPSPETREIPKKPNRAQIVEDALIFLNAPYLWGGRASYPIASVDCSGFIDLLYRAQGMLIPRNAHDQFLASQPTSTLQPGDLLYLAKESRVNHVILKLDDNTFIESPETGKKVRLLTWGKDLWKAEGKLHFRDRPHAYISYPRTFILT